MKNQKFGVISLFTAAAFYGLYGIFSRLIGNSFGNFGQSWLRNILVVVLCLSLIFVLKIKLIAIKKTDLKWIIFWVLSGSWITVLTFIAFNNLKIGTVYLLLYSAIIISGYFSGYFFFKEKIDTIKTFSLILAFIGISIIYGFGVSGGEIIYVFMVFVSGVLTGLWNTISKKFSNNYPNTQMVLMDASASVIAALIGTLLFHEMIFTNTTPISWFWLLLYAVIQMVNVGLIVYGFKNVEAQVGSLILPVEIIFAIIFAFLIFGEIPTPSAVWGGLFIISAAILPSIKIINKHKKAML